MATVIGIFEEQFEKKNPYQLLSQELKQEDLLMYMTQLTFVMRLGKK